MFGKKKCINCGKEISPTWRFCSHCGARIGGDVWDTLGRDMFSDIFSKIRKEMKGLGEMQNLFERDFEAIDLSPWFKKPRGKGFSIKIVQSTGRPPKIFVKTYGGTDKNKLEKEVYNKLGIKEKERPKIVEEERLKLKVPPAPEKLPTPKVTEEPKANIKRIDSKVVVDIQLPGVREENIEVKELESSVEVKAIAGEKAYFKILTKPPQFSVTNQSFSNGVLHLEFS